MKNKQFRKWALAAEIVSAVAVVVTIAFLAFQMRDNTNAMQAQTYQELMRDINNWRSSIRDAEWVLSGATLAEEIAGGSSAEIGLIRMTFLELWGIYEAAFFAKERGVLGDNEWGRFEFMICFQRNAAAAQAFWEVEYAGVPPIKKALTPAFVEYADEYLDKQCD